jgi:hypothetical protein
MAASCTKLDIFFKIKNGMILRNSSVILFTEIANAGKADKFILFQIVHGSFELDFLTREHKLNY